MTTVVRAPFSVATTHTRSAVVVQYAELLMNIHKIDCNQKVVDVRILHLGPQLLVHNRDMVIPRLLQVGIRQTTELLQFIPVSLFCDLV